MQKTDFLAINICPRVGLVVRISWRDNAGMLCFNLSSYYDKNAARAYGVFAPQEEKQGVICAWSGHWAHPHTAPVGARPSPAAAACGRPGAAGVFKPDLQSDVAA